MKVSWDAGGQILRGLDEVSLSSYVVGIAKSLVGLGANPKAPHLRRAYVDLVCPFNSKQDQEDITTKSGCGLVGLGLLRCLGVGLEAGREVWMPYQPGMAFSDVQTIGLRMHVRKQWDSEPALGDLVIVGTDPPVGASPERRSALRAAWGTPGHTLIVTGIHDGREVESVDGGQLDDEGYQTIKTLRRPIIRKGSQVWIGERRVYCAIRLREIARHLTRACTWPMI